MIQSMPRADSGDRCRARRSQAVSRPAVAAALSFGLSLGLSLGLIGCLDDTTGDGNGPPLSADLGSRALLIVGGDYQTSVLSRVDIDRETVVAPGFLHSGSRVGATGSAFSGDVVVGTVVDGSGDALALDRGRGVVTRLSGLAVTGQHSVSPGFFANPQDALAVPGELWIARGQRAPATGSAPLGTAIEGDDVLVLDATGKATSRMPLGPEATVPGYLAMAGSGAWDGSQWWLPLASIRDDFQSLGPGRIVAVGRAGGSVAGPLLVRARLDLPTVRNCRTIRRGASSLAANDPGVPTPTAPPGPKLVVVCSGSFAGDRAAQLSGSGVVVVASDGAAVVRVITAQAVGQRPFGFSLAVAADAPVAWVVDLGDLEAQTADRVWQLNLMTGEALMIRAGTGAFSLVTLWHDDVRSRLWAVDHNDLVGDLNIFDSAPALSAMPTAAAWQRRLASNPGGLRALEVGAW